jgi:hypothetical protein
VKLVRHAHKGGHVYYLFCPGCGHAHGYDVGVQDRPNWSFDPEGPTFHPSLKVFVTDPETRKETTLCHLFVKGGRIEFCGDSPHRFAGQTVDLPEFPENYGIPEPFEIIV